MRRKIILLMFLVLFARFGVSAQSNELTQLLLNIEKLTQFKQILSDMKKGYQLLEGGYNTVKGISEGNFSLHKVFLDGLMEVSSTVRNYKHVADIATCQVRLIKEYKIAYDRFRGDKNFGLNELTYISHVYSNLFKASLRNLDELLTVVTAGKVRMSDDERLQQIDKIYQDMQDKLMFLRHFNNSTTILAVQRAKESRDAKTIHDIYGIND